MSKEMIEYVVIRECLVGDHYCKVGEVITFPKEQKVPSDVFQLKSNFYGLPKKPEFEVKSTGGIFANSKQYFDEPKTVRQKAIDLGIKFDDSITDEGLSKLIKAHNK